MTLRAGVVVFPGSNCDRDLAVALRRAGAEVAMVWHKETALPPGLDLVGLPGGFSFGDYLRCGAIAARAPVMRAVVDFAAAGGHVIGVCNGFQVLIEAGLLPGALMRNAGLRFVCAPAALSVGTPDSPFTRLYRRSEAISLPVAHHDGAFVADPATLARLEAEDRVAFRYRDNPNGSMHDIAGVLSADRRVLGLMPHPERAVDPAHGGADGARLFAGLAEAVAAGALQRA
jgi:phosphoribosylformylglycinamidine synthase